MQSKKGYAGHQETLGNKEDYDWHPGDLPEHLSVLSSPILIINETNMVFMTCKGIGVTVIPLISHIDQQDASLG